MLSLQTVLDTLVKSVARLCEADDATIYRPRGDAYLGLFAYVCSTSISAHREVSELKVFINEFLFNDVLKACEEATDDEGKRFTFRQAKFKKVRGVLSTGRFGQSEVSYILSADEAVCTYNPFSKSAELRSVLHYVD